MAPCMTLLIKNCFSGYYLMEFEFLWLKFAILDISVQQPMVGHVLKQRKWINCVIKEIKCCLAKARWRLGNVCSLVNCFLLNEKATDQLQYPSWPKGGKSDLFQKYFSRRTRAGRLHCASLDCQHFSCRHVFHFFFVIDRGFCFRRSGSWSLSCLVLSHMKSHWHGILNKGGVKLHSSLTSWWTEIFKKVLKKGWSAAEDETLKKNILSKGRSDIMRFFLFVISPPLLWYLIVCNMWVYGLLVEYSGV